MKASLGILGEGELGDPRKVQRWGAQENKKINNEMDYAIGMEPYRNRWWSRDPSLGPSVTWRPHGKVKHLYNHHG